MRISDWSSDVCSSDLYGIKLLKFRLSGYFLAVYDHYQKPMAFEDDFFSNEIVLVEEGANKKDSAYWTTRRPVPLTDEEREGYHEKDSIARLKESESYLDSRSEEHTSELQSLMRISYAVFCLKKKTHN